MNHSFLEDVKICPYNSTHKIKHTKYINHVLKCAEHYPDQRFEQCIFNSAHFIPFGEMDSHLKECKERFRVMNGPYFVPEDGEQLPDGSIYSMDGDIIVGEVEINRTLMDGTVNKSGQGDLLTRILQLDMLEPLQLPSTSVSSSSDFIDNMGNLSLSNVPQSRPLNISSVASKYSDFTDVFAETSTAKTPPRNAEFRNKNSLSNKINSTHAHGSTGVKQQSGRINTETYNNKSSTQFHSIRDYHQSESDFESVHNSIGTMGASRRQLNSRFKSQR